MRPPIHQPGSGLMAMKIDNDVTHIGPVNTGVDPSRPIRTDLRAGTGLSEARISTDTERCRWVISQAVQPLGELVPRMPLGAATPYGWAVPIHDVAACDIAAGDVVRLDDPQAQRVKRAVHVDGRVVLELRPVGLDVLETSRVTLPADRLVSRLGTAAE